MAFSSGTASDRNDFLTKLKTFAVNEGWTSDYDDILATGRLSIHKNSVYVHFDTASESRSFSNNWSLSDETDNIIVAAQSTSFSSGNQANYHSHGSSLVTSFGDSNRAELRRLDTNFDYQFFSGGAGDPDYIAAVVEGKANQYMHIMFGDLDKAGTYTGGEFLLNTKWNWWGQESQNYFSTDHASFLSNPTFSPSTLTLNDANLSPFTIVALDNNRFSNMNIVGLGANVASADLSFNAHILANGQIGPSGITPLFGVPVMISLDEALSSNDYQYLGEIPNFKLCSLEGRTPKDEVTIGADTWVLYPFIKKGPYRQTIPNSSAGGTIWQNFGPSSHEAGFAIKKVV